MARFGDYINRPLDPTGLEGLTESLIKSYQGGFEASRLPIERGIQEQRDRLANAISERNLKYPGLSSSDPIIATASYSQYLKDKLHEGGSAQYEVDTTEEQVIDMPLEEGVSTISQPSLLGDNSLTPENMDAYLRWLLEGKIYDLNRKKQIVHMNEWDSMNDAQKAHTAGVANAIGIPPHELMAELNRGKSFQEVAKERGYSVEDLRKVVPKSIPTTSNITQQKSQDAAEAGLATIEDRMGDWMAPYIQTFRDYSILQTVDALKGESKEKQAKYLAARALQPEVSLMRLNAMGGNVTQGAVNEMIKKTLGEAKVVQAFIEPEVYVLMQKYIQETLKEAVGASRKAMYNIEPEESFQSTQMVKIKNKKTGVTETVSIEEARKRGAIK